MFTTPNTFGKIGAEQVAKNGQNSCFGRFCMVGSIKLLGVVNIDIFSCVHATL